MKTLLATLLVFSSVSAFARTQIVVRTASSEADLERKIADQLSGPVHVSNCNNPKFQTVRISTSSNDGTYKLVNGELVPVAGKTFYKAMFTYKCSGSEN